MGYVYLDCNLHKCFFAPLTFCWFRRLGEFVGGEFFFFLTRQRFGKYFTLKNRTYLGNPQVIFHNEYSSPALHSHSGLFLSFLTMKVWGQLRLWPPELSHLQCSPYSSPQFRYWVKNYHVNISIGSCCFCCREANLSCNSGFDFVFRLQGSSSLMDQGKSLILFVQIFFFFSCKSPVTTSKFFTCWSWSRKIYCFYCRTNNSYHY